MKKYMILLLFAVFTTNSYAQDSFNLGASSSSRFTVTDKVWPGEVGEADVCLWADDKLAAFSISIDDNIEYEVPFWKEMQAKYGFNFTWFVIGLKKTDREKDIAELEVIEKPRITAYNKSLADAGVLERDASDEQIAAAEEAGAEAAAAAVAEGAVAEAAATERDKEYNISNWDAYKEAVALGNEVEGHGVRNWYSAKDMDGGIGDGASNPDDNVYKTEIAAVKTKIETEIPGYKCLTYAYPYGIGNESVAKEEFIAIRGTNGVLNLADKVNYTNVNSVSNNHIYTEGGRDNYLLPLTTKDAILWGTNYYRGWASTHFHGLYNPTNKTTADEFLAYLSGKDLWVDGFTRVAQYSQSFATHSLTMGEVADASIKFTLTDGMDDDAFYFPLTVKVRINNAWSKVTATQNGESVDAKIITHEGSKYALVKAVPDAGEVTLAGEIGVSTFTFGTIEDIKLEVDKTTKMKFSATSSNPDDKITFSIKDKPSFITMASSEKEATYYKTKNNTKAKKAKNYTATNSESAVETLYAAAEDGYVSESKVINKYNDMKLGGAGGDGLATVVIPFQLPEKASGQEVTNAKLRVYVSWAREYATTNIDLYGLDYRSEHHISTDDHYVGEYSTSLDGATAIKDDYFAKNVEAGEIDTARWEETSGDGDTALADYINAQYAAGAKAGDWIFMRLSVDNVDLNAYQWFAIDGGQGERIAAVDDDNNNKGEPCNPAELSFSFQAASSTVTFGKEIGAKSMTENEELEVEFSATSSNGTVTFSLQNAISFATITSDNGSGKITFAPKSGDEGEYTVAIVASNGDVTATSIFTLTVVKDVAYRGEMTIAPKKEHLGEHNITIVATNGTDTAEKTFKITVVAVGAGDEDGDGDGDEDGDGDGDGDEDGDGDGDLSITEFGMETFQMYPNPVTNNVLTISTESFGKTFSVNIYSLSGNILYAEQVRNAGKKHQINVNFKKGIYIVCINDGEKIISKKLSVE